MKLFVSIVLSILSVMANGMGQGGNPNGSSCTGASGNSGVCGSNAGNDCPNICLAQHGFPDGRCNGVGAADCANSCFTCTPDPIGHTVGRTRVRARKF